MTPLAKSALMSALFFLLCGVIPTVLLIFEQANGVRLAVIYGHFFLYPLFLGWIPVFLVCRVLYRVLPLIATNRTIQTFWIGMLLIPAAGLSLEIQSENIAPFEVKAERVAALGFEKHFDAGEKTLTEQQKKAYQAAMSKEVADTKNWALGRYGYFLSYIGQVMGILATFFCTGTLLASRIRYLKLNEEAELPRWYRGALSMLSAASAIFMLYLSARSAFNVQKLWYFYEASAEINTWVTFGLFFCSLVLLGACLWFWIGKHIQAVFSLVFGGGGFVLFVKSPELLVPIFAGNSRGVVWPALCAGVVAFYWLWRALGSRISELLEEEKLEEELAARRFPKIEVI